MVGEFLSRRSKLMFALAILAVCAGLTLLLAREAVADFAFSRNHPGCCGNGFGEADNGGRVPESQARVRNGSRDCVLGITTYTVSTYPAPNYRVTYNMSIRYDWPEMRYENATAAENNRLRAHERYHSMAWAHGEGSPSRNKAHSPTISGVYC